MAGSGKSQLVYKYVAAHASHYWALVWFDATSEETLLADVRSTLDRLSLSYPTSPTGCVNEMVIWLQSQEAWPWLLVLDNYQHRASLIERLLAARGEGHVILTTRGQGAAGVQHILRLQAMPPLESTLLLLRRAHLLAPDATLDGVPSDLVAQAREIVRVVDGLPLVLNQIGAYSADTGESLHSCLERLQHEPRTLLTHRGTLVGSVESHPDTFTSR